MPELPDVEAYVAALTKTVVGHTLRSVKLASPFLLRTVTPAITEFDGQVVREAFRLHKRIVLRLGRDLFFVFHPMRAGRLRWRTGDKLPGRKLLLATLRFDHGTLVLTEAGTKKRAALHLVKGRKNLAPLRPPGVEPLEVSLEDFTAVLRGENHTLKRTLTDPRLVAGVGNAYSDEVLHAARLSPVMWTTRLTDEEIERLHTCMREQLRAWTDKLVGEARAAFPEKVTAFRPDMAVHGRFRQPCPRCGDPVQRIVYAERETNYCATCQTGGKVLADRALSRLLGKDWPRSLDALEEKLGGRAGS